MNIGPAVDKVVRAMYADCELKRATKYLSDKLIVRATRVRKFDRRDGQVEMVLTIGKPNAMERDFIKDCKIAGEPFPVKKIQLKWDKK